MPRHNPLRSLAVPCAFALAIAGLARPAAAQSTYGAVVGVVTDSTKAVTPGATVTLREVQTNVTRTTTSGGDGTRLDWRASRHRSGLYRLG